MIHMNLSPFSNQLLLLSQKKVRHFDFTLMRIPYTYIFGFITVFLNWSANYIKMRLSVVFELLLIFLIIAFAAYGRVGKSRIL